MKGIQVGRAVKLKVGKGSQRLRKLRCADGREIRYDYRSAQGGFGAFHRATSADGTPRGLKQFRLPEYVKNLHGKSRRQNKQEVQATPWKDVVEEAYRMKALGMRVYGIHRTPEGKAFIETDLYKGSLDKVVDHAALNKRAACARYVAQNLLKQLEPLHSRGFIHRDIKNANILFDSKAQVQVADPGIMATPHNIARIRQGLEASFAGTPAYMPPEMYRPGAVPSEKVDIWAAGCVYLEHLAGPWPLTQATTLDEIATRLVELAKIRQQYLTGGSIPNSGFWGPYLNKAKRLDPEGLRAVLTHALDFDPTSRSNAQTLGNMLAQAQHKGKAVTKSWGKDAAREVFREAA